MGALKKPQELSYDELNALTVRLFRELEVAHDAMENMYRRLQDEVKSAEDMLKSEHLDAKSKENYKERRYALRGLFDRYNEFPDKTYKLRRFIEKTKGNFREKAAEQWVRLEKFLSITNMDGVYRDIVTGDRIDHLDNWIDADKQEELVFNETRLYEAMGKDDARMMLAMWRRFHEILILRRRIDHEDDEYTPKIDPKEVIFRFTESELFQKMEHLLSWSKSHLPKTLVNKEAKGYDKHTDPQHKNLQRQLDELFERLKRFTPKLEKKA